MSEFNNYHPVSNFIYFTVVVIFSMFFSHPVYICISLVCAIVYSYLLNGQKSLVFAFCGVLPTIILALVINSAFNHAGVTILAYFPNGNPLTLESIIYGAVSGARLVSVIFWFACFNKLVTSDKLVYLFGKITPAFSLVLSMTLRFVPRFKNQAKQILNVNRSMCCFDGGITVKFKGTTRVLSTLIGIALEDSVEIADSMKRRGYGSAKRTAYSIFNFEKRDAVFFAIVVALCGFIVVGYYYGFAKVEYFPSIVIEYNNCVMFYIGYLLLCILPIIIDVVEGIKWKCLKSRI